MHDRRVPQPTRQELSSNLRTEPALASPTMLVRGGPDTTAKLRAHALRTSCAFALHGEPVWGVSVFAALDDLGPDSMTGILVGRLASYRLAHTPTVSAEVDAGFWLIPTFRRPHYTLCMGNTTHHLRRLLLNTLGPARRNPYDGRRPRGRRLPEP